MSTLTSASTLAQVQAAYRDNASYLEDASATKCRAFITACIFLMEMLPAEVQQGAQGGGMERLRNDLERLEAQIKRAESWLSTNGAADDAVGGGGVRHTSFEDFRG